MDYLHALFLGIVQGLTEFLPISSTAHLILTERLFGLNASDFGLGFDAAIQIGTTLAVIYYFRADLWNLVRNIRRPAERRLAIALVVATVPALVIGKLAEHAIEGGLRALGIIAATLIIGGAVFLWVEKTARTKSQVRADKPGNALLIGLAQSVALIPGVSRSGATIVAGMLLGLDRAAAARFTFLLSIPVILLAGGKKFYDVTQEGAAGRIDLIMIGLVAAAIVGYFTVKYLLRYLATHRLNTFAYYRFALGGLILLVLLLR